MDQRQLDYGKDAVVLLRAIEKCQQDIARLKFNFNEFLAKHIMPEPEPGCRKEACR